MNHYKENDIACPSALCNLLISMSCQRTLMSDVTEAQKLYRKVRTYDMNRHYDYRVLPKVWPG